MTTITRARIAELVRLNAAAEDEREPDVAWSDTPEEAALEDAVHDDTPALLAAVQLVADIAEHHCDCDEIATCDVGDRCLSCRARTLVTP